MVMTECINTNTFNRNFVTAAGTTKDEQQATSSTAENTHKSALISISYKTEGTFHMVREENWVSFYLCPPCSSSKKTNATVRTELDRKLSECR
jgi:hypothetical protein